MRSSLRWKAVVARHDSNYAGSLGGLLRAAVGHLRDDRSTGGITDREGADGIAPSIGYEAPFDRG